MNLKQQAITNLSDYLQAHVLKLKKEQIKLKEEKIVVRINHEDYECERDLMEAYGSAMITFSQYQKALKRFEDKNQEKIEIIKDEINLSIQLIQVLEDLIQKKKTK